MATMTAREAQALANLTSLISSPAGSSVRVYPNDDSVVSALQARTRSDLPYTYVGSSTLVAVNPLRSLANVSDASAQEYVKNFKGEGEDLQPHVYDLAGRVHLMMQQRRESQSVLYNGITGSGKSFTSKLFTDQILRLSSSQRDQKLANQIKSIHTLLDSFGSAKTVSNASASQHSRYLELHFTADGRIDGAKVLTFGLNKSRLGPKLMHDERSFHVFYQLLAGAKPDERESLGLEDMGSYALLASSGCYRLPGGPFSDDSIQLDELRVAMANLGFKAKHVQSIFSMLVSILLLGNLTFIDHGAHEVSYESATVEHRPLLADIAHHLGVAPEDLEQALTNQTQYVKKDLCSVFLNAAGAAAQRDSLVRNLYSILFAFVVETANRKLAPVNDPELQIIQLDVPGFQSRAQNDRAVATHGQNGFDEFTVNFSNEVVNSYLQRRTFVDDPGSNGRAENSGIKVPSVIIMDNSACMEMLRGGLLGNEKLAYKPAGLIGILRKAREGDDVLLDDLTTSFGSHGSFVTSPGVGLGPIPKERKLFGINHYAGQCSYDVDGFVEKSRDLVDSQLVTLLRNSTDSFVAKLVSGPSIATEGHPMDEDSIVEAQVSSAPLRLPSAVVAGIQAGGRASERSLDLSVPHPVSDQINATLASIFTAVDQTNLWRVACIRPNDSLQPNSFDKKRVKAQVRALLLTDLIARRAVEYSVETDVSAFAEAQGLRSSDAETLHDFAANLGWYEGRDYAIGHDAIWLSYPAWQQTVDRTRTDLSDGTNVDDEPYEVRDYQKEEYQSPSLGVQQQQAYGESADDLLIRRQTTRGSTYLGAREDDGWSEYDKEQSASDRKLAHDDVTGEPHTLNNKELAAADMVVKEKSHATVETVPTTSARRWWIRITWLFTWWIPSFLLTYIGRMKRPDIRMAWREKLTIFMMIFGLCGIVIFYIVFFGRLLCPDNDKAWNESELAEHAGTDDYYAAIAGKVYDFTNFYKGQHSDLKGYETTPPVMLQFAGQDLTNYFPIPMTVACPGLVTSQALTLQRANFTPVVAYAVHTSGPEQTITGTKLNDINWYPNELRPSLDKHYKGSYVMDKSYVANKADSDARIWAIYKDKVYDLSDYLYTVQFYSTSSGADLPDYTFLNDDITDLFKNQPGQDLTKDIDKVLNGLSSDDAKLQTQCLDNAFLVGKTDFRDTPRCTVQNYLLLAFSVLLMSTIFMKFVAALQLGSKRYPELLDKFVICQVPCYTEGEESLRKTIDSLADLRYDDKRKLIFIICDGNIIGSGNDRTTPRIVLDILGVDPELNPEPLLFKSIGDGSKQLNYAKVYSGLYEFEGHVVPYMVIVKVGKPSERSRPGNRGKRDSQVLLLQYLNRVHFDAPMSPLELEIYHQMRNVIGIDPAFYEYIFQVDADTTVTPDSLNRMIACAADDQRIIGICGETKLANERQSLTTMIQVYEYYISHHLTKAFESLFGSVTCLPGCFSVYRIRTADKGRPIIISSRVIDEYAEPNVDTLHKKNLFSLGEDRYLTTLMMKNFPTFKMKFTPDAVAHTVAPDRWGILLSQRRRWINSTIHNLVELLFLPEMCGFCFFSMRFIVFIDLLGTIILPATCVYLFYLIIVVATGKAAVPIISLAMIAAVYGLQALIFILKREFMLIGWMIVYILAFPIYSFFLPVYSFWSMDDFSWGNTRVVVGEGNNKTVISDEAEHYDDSMIPLKKFSEYEAEAWETRSVHSEKSRATTHSSATRTSRSQASCRGQYSRRPAPASVRSSVVPPGGDYWRDSSPLGHSGSNPNLRGDRSRVPSMAGMSQWGPGSVYGQPMNPFVESPAGSEYGFGHPGIMPGMQMNTAPRNSVMTNLNNFSGSMIGGYAPPDRSQLGMPRPMSTFSLATTHNPFAAPSSNSDPSEEELLSALRHLLSTQDLMTVTKRSVREALAARFPQADLSGRTAWINSNIDAILSGS